MEPTIPLLQAIAQYAVPAFLLIVAGILVLLFKAVKAWLIVRIGLDKFKTIEGFAGSIVRYLMQSPGMREFQSHEKKEYAVRWLIEKAKSIGYELDAKLADVVIEAAYATAKYLSAKAS